MKLSKALKLKNRLAGEVTRLKGIIQTRNVTEAGQDVIYDVKKIVEVELPAAIKNLVTVKTAIAVANAGPIASPAAITQENIEATPYWAIFMIAELKGAIEVIKAMDTKNGKFTDTRGFRETTTQVEYVAQVKQKDVDVVVASLEKQIDATQDELDAYNASTNIAVIDGIVLK